MSRKRTLKYTVKRTGPKTVFWGIPHLFSSIYEITEREKKKEKCIKTSKEKEKRNLIKNDACNNKKK